MSTKIYNGYRLRIRNSLGVDGSSFAGVVKFMEGVMARVREEAKRLAEEKIIGIAIHQMSRIQAGLKPEIGTKTGLFQSKPKEAHVGLAIALASGEYMDEAHEVKRTNQRNPEFDVSFSASLFLHEGDILAMTFCDNEELEKVWKRTPDLHYYGWWDNSDPQEGISEEDWEARRRAWSGALDDFRKTPEEAGMSFTAVPVGWFPWIGASVGEWTDEEREYAKKIALGLEAGEFSLEKRAKRIARNVLINKKYRFLTKGWSKKKFKEERFGPGPIFRAETMVSENPAELDAHAKKIQAKLHTVERMFADIPADFGRQST